jgi:hypothetical protein
VLKDSTWSNGFCRSFKVTNTGTSASQSWRLVFTLPTNVAITQSWSGTVSRSGNTVTVLAPSWAAVVNPGANVTAFGFCASGVGEPSAVSVAEVSSPATRTLALSSKSRAKAIAKARAEQVRKIKLARSLLDRRTRAEALSRRDR